ncbi:hypothetical protein OKW29_000181 [Paraburkholderia sp. CI3]
MPPGYEMHELPKYTREAPYLPGGEEPPPYEIEKTAADVDRLNFAGGLAHLEVARSNMALMLIQAFAKQMEKIGEGFKALTS